jgi:hypothetical protein
VGSTISIKKHKVNIIPDFIGSESKAYFSAVVFVIPIRIINAAIIFIVQFFFKVLVKLFLGSKEGKKNKQINHER